MSPKACSILVLFSAIACSDPHPRSEVALITPHTQAVRSTSASAHPVCDILARLDGRQRGASVDLTLTADGALVLLDGPSLPSAWTCTEPVSSTTSASRAQLATCTATHQDRALCLLDLDDLLAAAGPRLDDLPPSRRGELILNLAAIPDTDAAHQTLAANLKTTLTDFPFLEQLWITTDSPSQLRAIREQLDADGLHSVRLGLFIRDQNGLTHDTSLATSRGLSDITLVPPQLIDSLTDDLSASALLQGGNALGVYAVDSPDRVRTVLQYDGVRLAIGELAPEIEPFFDLPTPLTFDCEAFLDANTIPAFATTPNACAP